MGWAFIFEFYPERQRDVKSKNIKASPGQIRYFLTIRELYAHGIWWLFHLPCTGPDPASLTSLRLKKEDTVLLCPELPTRRPRDDLCNEHS